MNSRTEPRERAIAAIAILQECSREVAARALDLALNGRYMDGEIIWYWVSEGCMNVQLVAPPRPRLEIIRGGDSNVIRLFRYSTDGKQPVYLIRAVVQSKAGLRDDARRERTRAENKLVQGQPIGNDNDPTRNKSAEGCRFFRIQGAAARRAAERMEAKEVRHG